MNQHAAFSHNYLPINVHLVTCSKQHVCVCVRKNRTISLSVVQYHWKRRPLPIDLTWISQKATGVHLNL